MDVQIIITMLHTYIREEFIAISKADGNEIIVRFSNGKTIKVTVAEQN